MPAHTPAHVLIKLLVKLLGILGFACLSSAATTTPTAGPAASSPATRRSGATTPRSTSAPCHPAVGTRPALSAPRARSGGVGEVDMVTSTRGAAQGGRRREVLPAHRRSSPRRSTATAHCGAPHRAVAAHCRSCATSPHCRNSTHRPPTAARHAAHRPAHRSASTNHRHSSHAWPKPPAVACDSSTASRTCSSAAYRAEDRAIRRNPKTRDTDRRAGSRFHLCATATWRFEAVALAICVNRASSVSPPPPLTFFRLRGGISSRCLRTFLVYHLLPVGPQLGQCRKRRPVHDCANMKYLEW